MSGPAASLKGFLIRGLPVIKEGDDIPALLRSLFDLQDGDVLCLASTIVAKAEGRMRDLSEYQPDSHAVEIARELGKDPRFVQAVFNESSDVLIERPFLLVATRFGHIGVNAGIDQSNVGDEKILLLPEDPSASARRIRQALGKDCAVIITDTCGRPFRSGVAGVAVGWAGIAALRDWRGEIDIHGRPLNITQEAIVDEIAAAANLLMGEAGDATPAVVFRGLVYPRSGGSLFREKENDIIRPRLKT
ncbi:MAG: coenzyme F420-0:L-glutamate ligase [Methanothrix sp.]|uniref:coenzyme F420-0:L-glutamate ligase n=1 Tax=Methanothrix sp. TaxID=90426 RepID=UPI003BB09894